MKEVKIQIPDNCELIKDGDTYIVKEKKQTPPKNWKEFCKRYPIKKGEAYIDTGGNIETRSTECERYVSSRQNWCVSKEEAEAFLALMQLRQLRKAWVGKWEPTYNEECHCIFFNRKQIGIGKSVYINKCLTFPTELMAEDFLDCFGDLCETAKILL